MQRLGWLAIALCAMHDQPERVESMKMPVMRGLNHNNTGCETGNTQSTKHLESSPNMLKKNKVDLVDL